MDRRSRLAATLVLLGLGACGEDPVSDDLPPGAFTSEAAIDTFDDLGISSTTLAGSTTNPMDDDDPDDGTATAGEDTMSMTETGEPCEIPGGLSHAADIVPIWNNSCAVAASCHVAGGMQVPDLVTAPLETLLADQSPIAGAPYLTANDPDNSYVYLKIAGRQAEVGGGGGSMPVSPGELSACEAMIIEAWIEQGAMP